MSDKIRAYLLRVDKNNGTVYRGYVTEMEHSLKALQNYVNHDEPGGTIATVGLTRDIVVIVNDDGIAKNLPPNRIWFSKDGELLDILLGNLMCVRFDGIEDLTDIKDEDIPIIEKYLLPAGEPLGTPLAVENELPEYKECKKDRL